MYAVPHSSHCLVIVRFGSSSEVDGKLWRAPTGGIHRRTCCVVTSRKRCLNTWSRVPPCRVPYWRLRRSGFCIDLYGAQNPALCGRIRGDDESLEGVGWFAEYGCSNFAGRSTVGDITAAWADILDDTLCALSICVYGGGFGGVLMQRWPGAPV